MGLHNSKKGAVSEKLPRCPLMINRTKLFRLGSRRRSWRWGYHLSQIAAIFVIPAAALHGPLTIRSSWFGRGARAQQKG